MKTVRHIMSPVVYCMREYASLSEAAEALRSRLISGAPVIDRDGEYVGIISQSDISSTLAKGVTDLTSVMVREIMTSHILKISVDADMKELGQALMIAGVHRLLVVEEGNVVGLVSTSDLIQGVLESGSSGVEPLKRPARQPYMFETELSYMNGVVNLTSSFGNELVLEPPPEFGGSGRHSSPEDLFVASISACLCLTFSRLAEGRGLVLQEYRCRAIGRLEGDGVSLRFTRVDLYPRIKVVGSIARAERLLAQAKLTCLVGRSSDIVVALHPKIESESLQGV